MLPVSISSFGSDKIVSGITAPDIAYYFVIVTWLFYQLLCQDILFWPRFFSIQFVFNRTEYLLWVLINSLWLSFCGDWKNNMQAIFGSLDLIQEIKSQYTVEESIYSVVKQWFYPLHTIRCHHLYYFGQVYEEQENHLLKIELMGKYYLTSGLAMNKVPHVWQLHTIKHVLYYVVQ